MKRDEVWERIIVGTFWLVPVILILGYRSTIPEGPESLIGGEPGYAWLALPLSPQAEHLWLTGWRELGMVTLDAPDAVPEDDAAIPGPLPKVLPDSPEEPFRVRLHGRVRDGSRDLYCFFDTERRRWFRMAGGETDEESAIALELSGKSGAPHVIDLVDGARYGLLVGESQLQPLGEGN